MEHLVLMHFVQLKQNTLITYSLTSAMITGIVQGHDIGFCVRKGLVAAQHSLSSVQAIPSTITSDLLLPHTSQDEHWDPQVINYDCTKKVAS